MSKPIDINLYNYVKKLADKKFESKTGIYKSSWIVKEYKRRGGKYKGKKSNKKGILRWYKEKWVDLNRPIKDKKGKIIGYKSCGRSKIKNSKEKYPLCRPTYKITKSTPKTYSEISKKSILKAKKLKGKVKGKKNIQFGRGDIKCSLCDSKEGGGNEVQNETQKKDDEERLKILQKILKKREKFKEKQKLKEEKQKLKEEKQNKQVLKSKSLSKNEKIKKLIEKYTKVNDKYKEELILEQNEEKILYLKNKINLLDKAIKKLENKLKIVKRQSGSGKAQYYGKKSSIMVSIPKNVKKWGEYAFKLKKMGFQGAIETGIKRGKQLSSKEKIPIEDLRYMRNWYARHIYTSYPGFKKWIEAGKPKSKEWHNKRSIVSWIIWGGNAGFNWINSDKVIKMLNKHFDKNYKKIKIKV
jgi:hypothetical protein